MRKTMLKLSTVAIAVFFTFSGNAPADPVAVEGDYIFWADGDLKVLELAAPELPAVDTFEADNATDVKISGNKAVVTGDGELKVFDISSFVDSDNSTPGTIGECRQFMGSYNSRNETLSLPGVIIDDEIYTVEMSQRGASSNWEVSFIEEHDSDDGSGDGNSTAGGNP